MTSPCLEFDMQSEEADSLRKVRFYNISSAATIFSQSCEPVTLQEPEQARTAREALYYTRVARLAAKSCTWEREKKLNKIWTCVRVAASTFRLLLHDGVPKTRLGSAGQASILLIEHDEDDRW